MNDRNKVLPGVWVVSQKRVAVVGWRYSTVGKDHHQEMGWVFNELEAFIVRYWIPFQLLPLVTDCHTLLIYRVGFTRYYICPQRPFFVAFPKGKLQPSTVAFLLLLKTTKETHFPSYSNFRGGGDKETKILNQYNDWITNTLLTRCVWDSPHPISGD